MKKIDGSASYYSDMYFAVIIRNEFGSECQRVAQKVDMRGKTTFENKNLGLSAAYSMDSDLMFVQANRRNRFRVIPRLKSKTHEGKIGLGINL